MSAFPLSIALEALKGKLYIFMNTIQNKMWVFGKAETKVMGI